jgi:uncharacterized protein (TIGR02466 family)
MKIDHVFTNFLACDNLTIDAIDIQKFCYELNNKDSGKQISNIGGWQSNNIKLSECLPKLYYEIKERLDELYFYFEFKDDLSVKIDNSWVNINKKHNFNAPHDHSYGLFSGVYYVKAEQYMGDIVFMNPCSSQGICIDSHIIKTSNPFNSNISRLTPKTGMLILFPTWVKHYTEPNQTEEDRISISFNTSVI